MNTPESGAVAPESKRSSRRVFIGGASFLVGLLMISTPKYLSAADSMELKVFLLLVPWLAFGLVYGLHRRFWREDELEVLINRQALAFVFYFAFFGLLVIHHLQAAGFVPAIVWTTRGLVSVLALLLTVGLALSRMKYR